MNVLKPFVIKFSCGESLVAKTSVVRTTVPPQADATEVLKRILAARPVHPAPLSKNFYIMLAVRIPPAA
jgi:hypothetical protein